MSATPINKPAAYHGIRNVKFAKRLGENSYASEFIPMKYAKSLSRNPNVNESEVYADDRLILSAMSDTHESGDIGTTAADIVLEKALGWKLATTAGTADVAATKKVPGAVYYETSLSYEEGSVVTLKVWAYNVTLSKSSETFNTHNPTPDFGEYSYGYISRGEPLMTEDGAKHYVDENGFERIVFRATSLPGDEGYETFGDSVPVPKLLAAASTEGDAEDETGGETVQSVEDDTDEDEQLW